MFDQQGVDPTVAAQPERTVQGIAAYNFGSFSLAGLVAQTSLYGTNAANGEDSNTEYAISATLPLSANSGVFGMYADAERNDLVSAEDITQTQVAYYYDFSKRTRTYVGFNRLTNEVVATGAETDQDNFTIGLRQFTGEVQPCKSTAYDDYSLPFHGIEFNHFRSEKRAFYCYILLKNNAFSGIECDYFRKAFYAT